MTTTPLQKYNKFLHTYDSTWSQDNCILANWYFLGSGTMAAKSAVSLDAVVVDDDDLTCLLDGILLTIDDDVCVNDDDDDDVFLL